MMIGGAAVLETFSGCLTKDVLERCLHDQGLFKEGFGGVLTPFLVSALPFANAISVAWHRMMSRLSCAGLRVR